MFRVKGQEDKEEPAKDSEKEQSGRLRGLCFAGFQVNMMLKGRRECSNMSNAPDWQRK